MNTSKPKTRKKIFKISDKVRSRLNNSKQKKSNQSNIDTYVDDFKDYSNERIITLSKSILEELHSTYDDDLNLQLEALKIIMEERTLDSYDNNFQNIYPDYYDPNFNEKIYNKKEFNLNKIPKQLNSSDVKEQENISKKLCDPLYNVSKDNIRFKLTHNQMFLKSFLSSNTPYNSILLFHGTGVGKTCTSISIAEQYSKELKDLNKKIIILMNPSIQANFQKNIFNIQKVKQKIPYYQCTGDKYFKEINVDDPESVPSNILEKKISKLIKNRYNFFGYNQFANRITRLKNNIKAKYKKEDHIKMFNKKIKEQFSNSVMIIDEVHNIKESESLKLVPPLLEEVIKIADNIKLLLLSATPMFDNSKEIIFLINLMLLNDNRPIIHSNDFFDKYGNLKNKEKFEQKIRGYISFMRGEDPYRFPERRYPDDKKNKIKMDIISFDKMPKKNAIGNIIPKENKISDLKIVGCVMKGLQLGLYNKLEETGFGNFNKQGIMCSNIVFPTLDIDIENDSIDNFISNKGFNNIFKKSKKGKYSFVKDDFKDFFEPKNLIHYSSKITKIIEHIKKKEKEDGIIFIYSQYINNGLIPIALALEYMGYSKYNGSLMNNSVPNKGNYIIISGDNELSANAYEDYIKIQNSNKKGDKIKIILGSETAAEGLDFSYIREVHILDPWFHLNKIEQVIGRGIRNCSHIDLDKENRNVTIFMYAATKSDNPSNDNETIDLEIYRHAELKSKQMAEIEYLLKINSVDCELMKEGNIFKNDVDKSKKCNYKECKYKCNIKSKKKSSILINQSNSELNYDTLDFNKSIIKDNIDIVKNDIIDLFRYKYFYTIKDFKKIIKKDELLIYYALNDIVMNKIKIKNSDKQIGTINYILDEKNKIGYYFFNKIDNTKFNSFNNLRKSKKKRNSGYNISDLLIKESNIKIEKDEPLNSNNLQKTHDDEFNDFILNGIEISKVASKHYDNVYDDTFKEHIYGMMTDKKDYLLRYLILADYNIKSTERIKNHDKLIEEINNIITFKDLNIQKDGVWGYKIVNNNKLEYKKFIPEYPYFIPSQESDILKIKKLLKKEKDKKKLQADIIIYFEAISPNNTIFKILKKEKKKGKRTQINTGSICMNKKQQQLIEYILNLYIDESVEFKKDKGKEIKKEIKGKGKEFLCNYLIKQYFKKHDEPDAKYSFIYSPEETIEYELNKK